MFVIGLLRALDFLSDGNRCIIPPTVNRLSSELG